MIFGIDASMEKKRVSGIEASCLLLKQFAGDWICIDASLTPLTRPLTPEQNQVAFC